MDVVRISSGLLLAIVSILIFALAPLRVVYVYAAVVGVLGLWEWVKLSGVYGLSSQIIVTAIIALSIYMMELMAQGDPLLGLAVLAVAALFWLLCFGLVLRYPHSAVFWRHKLSVKLFAGFIAFSGFWFATLYLLAQSQNRYLVLTVVSLVAFADTGAYFSGRRFGKRKLSPRVSPGKSWEGVIGGMVLCAVFGIIIAAMLLELDKAIVTGLILSMPVAVVSVVGDLTESMLKREAGCKDSSRLIPGHGGVLDRIDALIAGLPVFAGLHYLFVVAL